MFRLVANILARASLRRQQHLSQTDFDASRVQSILLVELTRLGDVVTLLPTIESLRLYFPDAKISVAVQDQYVDLFRLVPAVNRAIGLKDTATISGFLRARHHIQREKFDLACSMSPSSRNSLLTLSASSPYKLGYFEVHDGHTPFLHQSRIESTGFRLSHHEVYDRESVSVRAGKIATAMGIPLQTTSVWNILPSSKKEMIGLLDRYGLREQHPFIVVHPFSGWKYRQWALERFVRLTGNLSHEDSAWIVVVGTKAEWTNHGQEYENLQRMKRVIVLDSLNIIQLAVLMEMADLFIGNDSGPLHLASSLGTKCIGLFGPAAPLFTGPTSMENLYLYHEVECSPCKQIACMRPENPCMQLISLEEVTAAAHKLLHRESVA